MAINDTLQQELIKDLLVESHEGLDRFDRELLILEKSQNNTESLNTIFRVIHTLKGTAGCLGLSHIEHTAHAGENLLSLVREGKLTVTPPMITTLLALSDALRGMLHTLETTGSDGHSDQSALLASLQQLQFNPASPALAPAADEGFGLFTDDEPALPPAAPAPAPAPLAPAPAAVASPETPQKSGVADNAIRVDIAQLDKVMNLVGELVLTRNQIVANTARLDPAALLTASQRLNLITTELQESVMKTRMQPIGNIWARFPRVVRDVAHELGKKVRLIMEGQSTELDRTIIEAIKDPLTHIIRNSIDHGIESPERRLAAGKAGEGLLSLRAYHEGGQVNIEIMDDGGGIALDRVKAKAVAQQLLTAEQAARLSDREAVALIFLPGLSTAEKLSNVSGRGVGMDVVKTNIERIGGSIDVQTEPGQGTTLKIKIPLTLAIIPALIVTNDGDQYAIPQASLQELVRLDSASSAPGIELLYGAPVYRLRGQLLPLVYLHQVFRRPAPVSSDAPANIVILQADGHHFGLVVDQINDTEEIVVKPLGPQLKGLPCYSGATIMGDGRVALILDVVGLAQLAHVINTARDRNGARLTDQRHAATTPRSPLLIFSVRGNHRLAIPLSIAARLEEIPQARVERSGRQEVVQYRGQILPLIRVADHLAGPPAEPGLPVEILQVVVYHADGRSIGLVVDQINDIVDETVTIRRDHVSPGLLGSVVVQDQVTDLLDVPGLIRASDPDFFTPAA